MSTDLAQQYLNYANKYAKQYNLDPYAMLAVARVESGLNPSAIGDNGSSFGYHQLHLGGVLGNMSASQGKKYLSPEMNISTAARLMAKAGASGLKGADAVAAIVNKFERPANPGAEISKAMQYYNNGGSVASAPQNVPQNVPQTASSDSGNPRARLLAYIQQGLGKSGPSIEGMMGVMSGKAPQSQSQPTAYGVPHIQAPLLFESHDALQKAPSPGKIGTAVVEAAKNLAGTPYVWGGADTKGFDCSGLVKYVFNKFGIQTPRVSEEQFKQGTHVKEKNMTSGDLIFFRHSDGDVGHVGIYIGNGQFIHAPHKGDVVKVSNLKGYGLPVAGIRRYTK